MGEGLRRGGEEGKKQKQEEEKEKEKEKEKEGETEGGEGVEKRFNNLEQMVALQTKRIQFLEAELANKRLKIDH